MKSRQRRDSLSSSNSKIVGILKSTKKESNEKAV